jgi:hypothetical protein
MILFRTRVAGAALFASTLATPMRVASGQAAQRADTGSVLPITPVRALSFTTDEGTWMSLDVSPDGKTIVFDLLGDVYTVPIGGGDARRLGAEVSAVGLGARRDGSRQPAHQAVRPNAERVGADTVRSVGGAARAVRRDRLIDRSEEPLRPESREESEALQLVLDRILHLGEAQLRPRGV